MRIAMTIANGNGKHETIPDHLTNGRVENALARALTGLLFTVLIWDDETQSFA